MKNKFFISIVFVFFITNIQAQTKFTVTATNKGPTSCNMCNGEINSYPNGGTPPYSFSWIGPNGFTSSNQNIIGLCAGNYSVTVTDANSNTAVASNLLAEDIFTGANWPINFVNTTGDEVIHDMVTDNLGNVYAIGTFTGDITFNPNITFTKSGSCMYGIFVAKLNYCGEVEMARYYGNVAEPNLHIERIASNNLIVVAGEFCSTIDFTGAGNPMTAVDDNDGFFATLDPVTLYSNANQQVHIFSNSTDIVNGISVNGTSVYVAGGFQGAQFQFSNSSTILTNGGSGYFEMFLCQFNCNTSSTSLAWANNYHLWASTWHDIGMTMQYVSGYIYFTYQHSTSSTVRISNLGRVSVFGGGGLLTQQIGSGTQFINVYDMVAGSNGYLYLCGYLKSSYSSFTKKAAVFYYPAPNTTIVLDPNNVRLSDQTSTYNEATKLVANTSGIFVSGTYDYNNFKIGYSIYWSQLAPLYGTIDHFVYKTDAALNPLIGWLSGVASATTGISKGNTLCYDVLNSVYYLGGTYNSNNLVLTGILGQTLPPSVGYDAFIARFQDNGGADYKSLQFFKDSLSKAENTSIIVYPNPSNGKFKVALIKNEIITGISISDLLGRQVYSKIDEISNDEVEINLSFLQQGNYFVTVSTLNNKYIEKLVIVK